MKRVIIDVENHGCPDAHIAPLLDLFEGRMLKASLANCRRAEFILADFPIPLKRGLGDYTLTIERLLTGDADTPSDDTWIGTFTHGEHRLKVMGALEA